jgi:hypothetical protein
LTTANDELPSWAQSLVPMLRAIIGRPNCRADIQTAIEKWVRDYKDRPMPFPVCTERFYSNDSVERLVICAAIADVAMSCGEPLGPNGEGWIYDKANWRYHALCGHVALLESVHTIHLEQCVIEVLAYFGVSDPAEVAPAGPAVELPPTPRYRFERSGECYSICFEQGDVFTLKETKGLNLISILLREPHRDIPVMDLECRVVAAKRDGWPDKAPDVYGLDGSDSDDNGDTADRSEIHPVVQEVAQTVIDTEAVVQVKADIDNLRAKLDRTVNPSERLNVTRTIDKNEEYLRKSKGMFGRLRYFSNAHEKARGRVTKAIGLAVSAIALRDQALGRHLGAAIRTGTVCGYWPEKTVPWQD